MGFEWSANIFHFLAGYIIGVTVTLFVIALAALSALRNNGLGS